MRTSTLVLSLSVAAIQGPLWAAPRAVLAPGPAATIAEVTVLSRLHRAVQASDGALRRLRALVDGIGARPAWSPKARAAEEYARGELTRVGLSVRLEPVSVPCWVRGAEAAELVEYPGRPEGVTQPLVLSAHLDSWDLGRGALDDGAGVAMVLSAIEQIAGTCPRPTRTIRVVLWTNEEMGRTGASTYLREHAREMGDCVAAIEADRGAGRTRGFLTFVPESRRRELSHVLELARLGSFGTLVSAGAPVGSDIPLLGQYGVPTFIPLQDDRTYYDYHHTAADTLDKVDPHDLGEGAAALAVLAHALASAPARAPAHPPGSRPRRGEPPVPSP